MELHKVSVSKLCVVHFSDSQKLLSRLLLKQRTAWEGKIIFTKDDGSLLVLDTFYCLHFWTLEKLRIDAFILFYCINLKKFKFFFKLNSEAEAEAHSLRAAVCPQYICIYVYDLVLIGNNWAVSGFSWRQSASRFSVCFSLLTHTRKLKFLLHHNFWAEMLHGRWRGFHSFLLTKWFLRAGF